MIERTVIRELLRLRGGRLFHREGQELEFKEQFNLAGLSEYFRDFAAFANNRGGYLVFGVKDVPRELVGLSPASLEQFEKIDPEKITGYLLDIFSSSISWDQTTYTFKGKTFGVFHVLESKAKPVIAKKDEGKSQTIRNGEVYYRYGGRTQRIQHAELEQIINKRIEQNNLQWLDLMAKIGSAGPQNAAILDTEKALIEKNDSRILVLDEGLANKLKFVKDGDFSQKTGAPTLKLVGDVVPVTAIEVVKKVKEDLIRSYPLSALELVAAVQKAYSKASPGDVWDVIKHNKMKDNSTYSAYNFRNKTQEDRYKETGEVPNIPSIYNSKAVDFIAKILRDVG